MLTRTPDLRHLASHTLLMGLLLCLSWTTVLAGGGSIVPAPPNAFGIRGLMNVTINFRYPPTAADIAEMETAIREANEIICDATDGQIVFGQVNITAGSVNETLADIWVHPFGGRSGVSFFPDGSGLRQEGSQIHLFRNGIDGAVIAHELGHLAFGIGDNYDEQCRFGVPAASETLLIP